jgi:predicted dehydrogenase
MKRRDFLKKSTVATLGAAAPFIIPTEVFGSQNRPGANDRIAVGFVGIGGRARWIMKYDEMPDAQIVAVADIYKKRFSDLAKEIRPSKNWNKYDDYHEMFEKEKLDAVFVETPTHARVLILIQAMQAGLDVYGEKPLTLTIAEGRTLVNTARKLKRILQTGTQQRSMPINRYASKLVHSGAIGKIHTVKVCNFEGPKTWVPKQGQPIPKGLNWDQWCNQTELRPYHEDLHVRWNWWRDYDGGGRSWGVTGWGTHSLDQVQCGLGTDTTGPVEIWPEGKGETADVTMRYASGTLLKMDGKRRQHQDLGGIFLGEDGKIEILRGNFLSDKKELFKDAPPPTPEGAHECEPHLKNFFDCIRSRKLPNADVEIGHRSTTVCYLVNICRDLGRKLKWDPDKEQFIGDDEANKMLSRPRREGYELPIV